MKPTLSILLLGDIVGSPGRRAVTGYIARLDEDKRPDLIIANVENAAHGYGITEDILNEMTAVVVQVFSGGNHTFARKEIFNFIDKYPNLLRPATYPLGTPGRGWCVVEVGGCRVGVVNLMGRAFMDPMRS